jgi:hypothetical protein
MKIKFQFTKFLNGLTWFIVVISLCLAALHNAGLLLIESFSPSLLEYKFVRLIFRSFLTNFIIVFVVTIGSLLYQKFRLLFLAGSENLIKIATITILSSIIYALLFILNLTNFIVQTTVPTFQYRWIIMAFSSIIELLSYSILFFTFRPSGLCQFTCLENYIKCFCSCFKLPKKPKKEKTQTNENEQVRYNDTSNQERKSISVLSNPKVVLKNKNLSYLKYESYEDTTDDNDINSAIE